MRGLLRKDLYVADKQTRLLLGLALLFCLLPRTVLGSMSSLGNTYAIMLAFVMPMSTISYDERCKWDRYAAMLPYKPEQIVWGKYLLCYIFTLLGAAIILLGAAAQVLYGVGADIKETLEMLAVLIMMTVSITAIGLPVLYRFGSEKGRLALIVVMTGGIGAVAGLYIVLDKPSLPVSLPVTLLAGLLLAAGLTAASFRLSLRFYRNRRDGIYQ